MEGGQRGQAVKQISLAGRYESTTPKQMEAIKIETTAAVQWLVDRMPGCVEVNLEQVLRQCPKACHAMMRDAILMNVVVGMLNAGAKAANLVLSQGQGHLGMAYRRPVSLGEAGRLQGYDHTTTEDGAPLEDPGVIDKKLVDDGANIWGICLMPSQLAPGAKLGELPRSLCKPTTAGGETDALYSIVGNLEQMAPEYTLWKLCASGSDANTFACLVRLTLRCG